MSTENKYKIKKYIDKNHTYIGPLGDINQFPHNIHIAEKYRKKELIISEYPII